MMLKMHDPVNFHYRAADKAQQATLGTPMVVVKKEDQCLLMVTVTLDLAPVMVTVVTLDQAQLIVTPTLDQALLMVTPTLDQFFIMVMVTLDQVPVSYLLIVGLRLQLIGSSLVAMVTMALVGLPCPMVCYQRSPFYPHGNLTCKAQKVLFLLG